MSSKIITIVLAIAISLAALTILYVNLPDGLEEDTTDESLDDTNPEEDGNGDGDGDGGVEEESIILTITYGTEIIEYTLSGLGDLEAYDGSGSYIKIGALPDVIIKGPYSYTGVKFTTLLDQFDNLPENYNLTVAATDGWTTEYTMDQINGNVDLYNETTGEATEEGTVTMILAYKENGEDIPTGEDESGPIRVAFVGEDVITASDLWSKKVASIEITSV